MGEVKKVGSELHFYQTIPSKLLIEVMAGVLVAFGLLLLSAGLGRLSYGGLDEIVIIVMGIVAVIFAVLFYRFVLGARIVLTDEEMRVRDFFRTVRFRYADIAEFASGTRMVRPYRVPAQSALTLPRSTLERFGWSAEVEKCVTSRCPGLGAMWISSPNLQNVPDSRSKIWLRRIEAGGRGLTFDHRSRLPGN